MGIYSHNYNGHPGLLLSAGSASASAAGTWTSVSVTPIELVAGRVYRLAILGEGGTLRYRDRRQGPCPSETSGQTPASAPCRPSGGRERSTATARPRPT